MAKGKPALDFTIHVPVFISDKEPISPLFEETYQSIVDDAAKAIEIYNARQSIIVLDSKRNKHSKRQVGKIHFQITEIGERPTLLLNACAYAFNKSGEHIKGEQVFTVEPPDKIGDSSNYFLLVPQITGTEKQMYNWIALAYDDPTRESEDIIAIVKAIMKDVLHRPVKNIKLPELLEELKQANPEITLNLNAISFEENNQNDKFLQYQIESKSVVSYKYKFSGMPIEKIKELIEDRFEKKFKKVMKFYVGKKEYKIQQEIDKFKSGANLLVEQYFNFEEIFSTTEFHKIHNQDFVIKTLTRVLDKYLKNGQA